MDPAVFWGVVAVYVGFLVYLILVSWFSAVWWCVLVCAAPRFRRLHALLEPGSLVSATASPSLCPPPRPQTPEGAQRLAATISRNVSRLSLLGGGEGGDSEAGSPGTGGRLVAEQAPLLPPPPSSFDQPHAAQQAEQQRKAQPPPLLTQPPSQPQPQLQADAQQQRGRGGAAAAAGSVDGRRAAAQAVAADAAGPESDAETFLVSGYVST